MKKNNDHKNNIDNDKNYQDICHKALRNFKPKLTTKYQKACKVILKSAQQFIKPTQQDHSMLLYYNSKKSIDEFNRELAKTILSADTLKKSNIDTHNLDPNQAIKLSIDGEDAVPKSIFNRICTLSFNETSILRRYFVKTVSANLKQIASQIDDYHPHDLPGVVIKSFDEYKLYLVQYNFVMDDTMAELQLHSIIQAKNCLHNRFNTYDTKFMLNFIKHNHVANFAYRNILSKSSDISPDDYLFVLLDDIGNPGYNQQAISLLWFHIASYINDHISDSGVNKAIENQMRTENPNSVLPGDTVKEN